MKRIKYKLTGVLLASMIIFSGTTATALGATVNQPNKVAENASVALEIAQEGTVLLKNDYGALPFKKSDKVAGLGSAQDTAQIFGGGGSGWVNSSGLVTYRTGLEKAASDGAIRSYEPIGSASYKGAFNKIIYFVNRATTEGSDLKESEYYLDNIAKSDISTLISLYGNERIIVVLNVGTVCDTTWLIEQDVAGIVLAYYGGEQAGYALADVLTGKVAPSGKVVDTWAKSYDYYPSSDKSGIGTFAGDRNTYYTEDVYVGYRYFATFDKEYEKVNYEFGYGLSYTDFELSDYGCAYKDGKFTVTVKVTNRGAYSGKETVQVYFGAPEGKMGAPAAELAGFAKTKLLSPGASETLNITFAKEDFARYDDTGKIKINSWVIESGNYEIYAGNSIKNAFRHGSIYSYEVKTDEVVETTSSLRETTLGSRLLSDGTYEALSDSEVSGAPHKIPAAGSALIQAENYARNIGSGTSEIYYLGTDSGYGLGNLNQTGNMLTYELDVEKAGTYKIAFNMSSAWDGQNNMFRLFVNDELQNISVSMDKTHTDSDNLWHTHKYLKSNAYTVKLPAGKTELKFVANGLKFMNFDSFVIYNSEISAENETLVQAENFDSSTLGTEQIADGAATARSNSADNEYVYRLNSSAAGKYYISFKASNIKRASADALEISVNGVVQNVRVALERTAADGDVLVSNYHAFTETAPAEITLPAGEITLKLKTKDEAVCCIDSFKIIPESKYVASDAEFKDNTDEFFYNDSTEGKTFDKLITYNDVYANPALLDDFVSQFSIEELARLLGLDKEQTDAATGVGGVGGMFIDDKYGVPFANASDGPAGIRYVDNMLFSTWFPCMTMLASTWNTDLARRFGEGVALEAALGKVSVWLAPGVNIHRNPLCGRNFEYFSEDPLVAGIFGAEITKAAQARGVSVCVKHYAANNQETNRFGNNSCVSARALREIYLKPFEIVVKESNPNSIMSSYNMVNGLHAASSYDLITEVLRGDWGFDGVVFSDWDAHMSHITLVKSGNTFKSYNPQYDVLLQAYKSGVLTREDFERNAKDTIKFLIKSNCDEQKTTVINKDGLTELTEENITKAIIDNDEVVEFIRFSVEESGYYLIDISEAGGKTEVFLGDLQLKDGEPVFIAEGSYELCVRLSGEEVFGKIVLERTEDPEPDIPDVPDVPVTPVVPEKPGETQQKTDGLGAGAIAGIAVASAVAAGGAAAGAAIAVKKRRNKK